MLTSSKAKVQQHCLSVVAGSFLKDVQVCCGQGAAGGVVELYAFVPQRLKVGLVLKASVRVHKLPGKVVGLSNLLKGNRKPFKVGFDVLVVELHLVGEKVEFINDNLVGPALNSISGRSGCLASSATWTFTGTSCCRSSCSNWRRQI